MDYHKIYESLITRAATRTLETYKESHHIIPRCMGGTDNKDNLVNLTPEEHYLAHLLLVKMNPTNIKLVLAAHMMTVGRTSNKVYGWLRRRHSDAMSDLQAGENNSQFGKKWIHNTLTNQYKKIKTTDPTPVGWANGRVSKIKQLSCAFCKTTFVTDQTSKFCSDKCYQYNRSPAIAVIDANIDTIISQFAECGSMTKVLNSFGISGRRGNRYLSKILKSKGFSVLYRYNGR